MKKFSVLKFLGIIALFVLILFGLNALLFVFFSFLTKYTTQNMDVVFGCTLLINLILLGIFLKKAAQKLSVRPLYKILILAQISLLFLFAIWVITSFMTIGMFW